MSQRIELNFSATLKNRLHTVELGSICGYRLETRAGLEDQVTVEASPEDLERMVITEQNGRLFVDTRSGNFGSVIVRIKGSSINHVRMEGVGNLDAVMANRDVQHHLQWHGFGRYRMQRNSYRI